MTDISKHVLALMCCASAIRGGLTEDEIAFVRQEYPSDADILMKMNASMKAIRQTPPTNLPPMPIKISVEGSNAAANDIAMILGAFNNGVK